jgi:hypothetical protein
MSAPAVAEADGGCPAAGAGAASRHHFAPESRWFSLLPAGPSGCDGEERGREMGDPAPDADPEQSLFGG